MNKLEVLSGLTFSVNTVIKTLLTELQVMNIDYEPDHIFKISITAALEYVLAEILELSGNAVFDSKKVRMTPDHIIKAISHDTDLKLVFDTEKIKVDEDTPKYDTHTRKILMQVHPDTNLTVQGSRYVDALIYTFIKACAQELQRDKNADAHKIIDSILPENLAKFAKTEIGKSILKYNSDA